MITLDVRHAILAVVAEAGFSRQAAQGQGREARGHETIDPGLRPGGHPGEYASSVAFALAQTASSSPLEIAGQLAACLAGRYAWIAEAKATGQGYLTIAVTPDTIAALAGRITEAGAQCVQSDALVGQTFPIPDAPSWKTASTWDKARDRLTTELIVTLAVAAGGEAGEGGSGGEGRDRSGEKGTEVAAGLAFAGTDAVLFSLARAIPGRPLAIDPAKIARQVTGNPAYAVRYAHARAASGVRWAAALGTGEAGPQRPPADPEELTLLDMLSWLPERVASAARRGRPDEFARFLERLADLTLSTVTRPTSGRAPGSDKLAIASAARTGLAAGLGLLGVTAPDRQLGQPSRASPVGPAPPSPHKTTRRRSPP